MNNIQKGPISNDPNNDTTQIYRHLYDKTKEKLLDELMDFLCETDEYTYDATKHETILAELAKFDATPEEWDAEESLATFHAKYAPLFAADEATKHCDNLPRK